MPPLTPEQRAGFLVNTQAKQPEVALNKALTFERARREARRQLDVEEATRPIDVPPLVSFPLTDFITHQFPERRVLLARHGTPVFQAGHLGMIHAERGVGKTWLTMSFALTMALGAKFLDFECPEPCRVLYVDGEMSAQDLQQRFIWLLERLPITPMPLFDPSQDVSANLTLIAADCQLEYMRRLDTREGQAALEPLVAVHDVVILDNRSCLFDPEGEKDATAWRPAQDWLLSLRRQGKGVLTAHHSNRMGGARGHSGPEDPLNLILKLTRPEDYSAEQGARFLAEFTKGRSIHGDASAPFIAALTDTGWRSEEIVTELDPVKDKLREYLRAENAAGNRPANKSACIKAAKVNRGAGFAAWKQMVDAGEIEEHADGGFHLVGGDGR
jgi:hypothetical protein